jgi:hypothetical protein
MSEITQEQQIEGNKVIAIYEGGYFVPVEKHKETVRCEEHFEFDCEDKSVSYIPHAWSGRAKNPAWQKLEKNWNSGGMVNMYWVPKIAPKNLKYHIDWNWLVAVVKKLLPDLKSLLDRNLYVSDREAIEARIRKIENQSYDIDILWNDVVGSIEDRNRLLSNIFPLQ